MRKAGNSRHARLAQRVRGVAGGTQDRSIRHEGPEARRIVLQVLLIVQGQDVGLHPAGGDVFHAAVFVAVVTVHLGRHRRHRVRPRQLHPGDLVAHDDRRELVIVRHGRRTVAELGERDAHRLEMVAGHVHRAGQALAGQTDVVRQGDAEQGLHVVPEIRLLHRRADGVGVVGELVTHRHRVRHDLRRVADLDHLRPQGVVGRQHGQILEFPVVAVHTQVVPRQHDPPVRCRCPRWQRRLWRRRHRSCLSGKGNRRQNHHDADQSQPSHRPRMPHTASFCLLGTANSKWMCPKLSVYCVRGTNAPVYRTVGMFHAGGKAVSGL